MSYNINVTGSAKTGLIAHDRKFIFVANTKTHQYTIKSHYQNEEVLGGLLLPSPLAIHTSGLGSSWSSGGKVED